MIEVAAVRPNPREIRPVTRGWGWVHWIVPLPTMIPYAVMVILAVLVIEWGPPDSAPMLAVALVTGCVLAASLLTWLIQSVLRHKALGSPSHAQGHDWLIDAEGVRLTNALIQTRYCWEGFHEVLDEKDRFVFLVSVAGGVALPKRLITPDQIDQLRALTADVRASGRMGRGVD